MQPRTIRLPAAALVATCVLLAPAARGNTFSTLEENKFMPGALEALDNFGEAVAFDGDTAVIGSVRDDDAGTEAGAVYVCVRNGTTWTLEAKLTASDAVGGELFGGALALDGDTLIVGAEFHAQSFAADGAAYVFVRTGTTWSEQAILLPGDPGLLHRFGSAVDVDGNTAIVGAPEADGGAADSGAAYVFARSGTTWTQEAKLQAADPASFDRFGDAVAVDGNTALVGAPLATDVGSTSGAAYAFTLIAGTWAQEQKLLPAVNAPGALLGSSVALEGDRAAIGAPAEGTLGNNAGAVWFFTRTSFVWDEEQILFASDGSGGAGFGGHLDLEGNALLVGAPGAGPGGAAYVFREIAGTWVERQQVVASDVQPGDGFGISVGLASGWTVCGARTHDAAGNAAGAAYAHRFQTRETFYCSPKTNSQGCMPSIGCAGAPSAGLPIPFHVTASNVLNNKAGLLFYGITGRAARPFLGGLRCMRAPLMRTAVQMSGGNAGPADCTGSYTFDFNVRIQSGIDPTLMPGTVVYAQYWSRDNAASFNSGLTDALEFEVFP